MENKIDNTVQFYSLFIFFLIVSSNYLGELFPCKVQTILTNNVYWKHFFGFLTLLFFVVLVDPFQTQTLVDTLWRSIGLYVVFLLLINNNIHFFFTSMVLLALSYLLNLHKQYNKQNDVEEEPWVTELNNILYILFLIVVVVGFLVYMGEKKIEYKSKFHYLTFLFGRVSCKMSSPKTTILQSLHAALTK